TRSGCRMLPNGEDRKRSNQGDYPSGQEDLWPSPRSCPASSVGIANGRAKGRKAADACPREGRAQYRRPRKSPEARQAVFTTQARRCGGRTTRGDENQRRDEYAGAHWLAPRAGDSPFRPTGRRNDPASLHVVVADRHPRLVKPNIG